MNLSNRKSAVVCLQSLYLYLYSLCIDIVLVAPSVGSLQTLLTLLETLLENLDMRINATKYACIAYALDQDMMQIARLTMKNGEAISWVTTCRYLGVYFVSDRELKCCFDQAKQKFFRSFNAICSLVTWDALHLKRYS